MLKHRFANKKYKKQVSYFYKNIIKTCIKTLNCRCSQSLLFFAIIQAKNISNSDNEKKQKPTICKD